MIFDNKPIESLDETNDLFGLLGKAKTIVSLLNSPDSFFNENQMMAIYGDWGTGKTTLLKYIQQNVDRDKYYPIFFEAWKNEKDENLAVSLASTIASELKGPDLAKIGQELVEICKGLFIGFAKSISVRVSHPLLPISFGISPDKIFDEIKEQPHQSKSYSEELGVFSDAFQKVEYKLLKNKKGRKLLLLIDDLDRCEPENILNLISAIKLFFTYGKNTVYLCGVDKSAVSKAIQNRYKDVVKADEYLEKIFDLTLNMPRRYDLDSIFKTYFDTSSSKDASLPYSIKIFFEAMGFTNPRHVKKVLNKYTILSRLKIGGRFNEKIPEIITYQGEDDQGFWLDSIFVLYFIILLDYYPKAFAELTMLDERISTMTKYFYDSRLHGAKGKYPDASKLIRIALERHKLPISALIKFRLNDKKIKNDIEPLALYLLLLPIHGTALDFSASLLNDDKLLFDQYGQTEVALQVRFCRFLASHMKTTLRQGQGQGKGIGGEFTISELVQVIDMIL